MKGIGKTAMVLALAMLVAICAARFSDFSQSGKSSVENLSQSTTTSTSTTFASTGESLNNSAAQKEPRSDLPVVRLLTQNKVVGYVCERLFTFLFGS